MDVDVQEILERIQLSPEDKAKLQCCACHLISLKSLRSPCDHLFCCECVALIVATRQSKCPIDDTMLSKDTLIYDAKHESEVMQIQVNCPKICKKKLKLSDLKTHVCGVDLMLCPQGCGNEINYNELIKHLQDVCTFRHVVCEYCDNDLVFANLKTHHQETCRYYPVPCPFQCGQKELPRSQMMMHSQMCSNHIRKCKFYELGCPFMGPTTTIPQHEGDIAFHMELLLHVNLQQKVWMECVLNKMNANFDELKNENSMLKFALEENNQTIVAVKDFTEKLTKKVLNIQTCMKTGKFVDNFAEQIVTVQDAPNDKFLNDLKQRLEELNQLTKDVEEDLKGITVRLDETQKLSEANVTSCEEHLKKLELKITSPPKINGIFVWKVKNFKRINDESLRGIKKAVYSDPFFTHEYGYKMCLCLEPRQDSLAVFVNIMKGSMDDYLDWPCTYEASITLFDQKSGLHLQRTIAPDRVSYTIQKPKIKFNPGFGYSDFVSMKELRDQYLLNDTLIIKIKVVIKI